MFAVRSAAPFPDHAGRAAAEAEFVMDRMAAPPFSAADFRTRAAAQLPARQDEIFGDHRFNPGHPRLSFSTPLRDAAVLVPIVDHGSEATVLLTKRSETLRSHTGQVAFPGGRIDPGDPTPEATALRETAEEVGLDSGFVELVGRMPDYVSGSGYASRRCFRWCGRAFT